VDGTRDELLARPGLAADEDGRVCRGGAFDELRHLAHGRGPTQQSVEDLVGARRR